MPKRKQKSVANTPQLIPSVSHVVARKKQKHRELSLGDLGGWTKEWYKPSASNHYQVEISYEGDDLDTSFFTHQTIEKLLRKDIFSEQSFQIEMVDTFADETTLFLVSNNEDPELFCAIPTLLQESGFLKSDYDLDYRHKEKVTESQEEEAAAEEEEEENEEEEKEEEKKDPSFLERLFLDLIGKLAFFNCSDLSYQRITNLANVKPLEEFLEKMYYGFISGCLEMGGDVQAELYDIFLKGDRPSYAERIPHRRQEQVGLCYGCNQTKQRSLALAISKDTLVYFGSYCAARVNLLIRYFDWIREVVSFMCQPGLAGKSTNLSISYHLNHYYNQLVELTRDIDNTRKLA